jgi:hypothetical protein
MNCPPGGTKWACGGTKWVLMVFGELLYPGICPDGWVYSAMTSASNLPNSFGRGSCCFGNTSNPAVAKN